MQVKNEKIFGSWIIGLGLIGIMSCTSSPNATPVSRIGLFRDKYAQAAYEIDTLISHSPFNMAYWGIKIIKANSGDVIYERNAEKMFMPASNMKLYTTSAALCRLGPDYTYKTTFWTDGELNEKGILSGNLYLRGSGDPTWSWRFYDHNYDSLFVSFADSLKAHGITEITGAIVGDDNVFDDDPLGYGWSWDDEPYYYGAQLSGLSYNENYIDYQIFPGAVDSVVTLIPYPDTDYLKVKNELVTVDSDSVTKYDLGRERARNNGWFKGVWSVADSMGWDAITIENPTLFTVVVLKQYLQRNGVQVHGDPRDVDNWPGQVDYNRYQPIFTHTSPPLYDIVYHVNKPSQNFIAETLQKTLGAEFGEAGSNREGIKVEMALFDSLGVDTRNLTIRDGSGLSRLDLVSPNTTTSLLNMMWNHGDRDYLLESLPQSGVDGTIKNRMLGTLAEGRVRAKTGYVSYVRSLSGYLWTKKNEEPLIFSLMVNHYTVPTSLANQIQDQICTILVGLDQ